MATPKKRIYNNSDLIAFRVQPHHLKMLQFLAKKDGISKAMMARKIITTALDLAHKELEQ